MTPSWKHTSNGTGGWVAHKFGPARHMNNHVYDNEEEEEEEVEENDAAAATKPIITD
jgi:hypothetical protein